MLRFVLAATLLAANLLGQPSGVTAARYAALARGVNIETWFLNGSGIQVGPSDVNLLKATGFTCVRLTIFPNTILPYYVPASTASAYLADADSAVDLFLNAGIAVMLDFHADTAYYNYYISTPAAAQELVSTWQMLAKRYSNRDPDLLFFEVLNEPDYRVTQAQWDVEQQQVVAAIHQVAPNNTILVEPVCCGVNYLLQMTPYSDPNLIYAFHDYNPITFTHQGANWITNPAAVVELSNVPYPSYLSGLQTLINQTSDPNALSLLQEYQSEYWDSERTNWDIQLVAAWAKMFGVRLVINEFGVYKPYSPPDSRARWLHDITASFAANDLGWAMWDYDGGFDLVIGPSNARTIDPSLLPALGFQTWTAPALPQPNSPPVFTDLRSVQVGGAPVGNNGYGEGLIVVDLNGDGLPDVVMTPIDWPSLPEFPVQVLMNQGGGVMSPAKWAGAVPSQQFVDVIVPGKFDHSGRLGVFLPDQGNGPTGGSGAQSKLILPTSANSLFDASSNLPKQLAYTIGAAAGDVDGDGIDDLAVFYSGSNRLPMEILRNDGKGVFKADASALPSWVSDVSNGNNSFVCGVFVPHQAQPINDLVAIGWPGTGGRVFRNDGTGKFLDGAILPPPPGNLPPATGGCAVAADINGDGNVDIILGFQHAAANQPDFVQILINNGDGTFHDETDLRIGPLPGSLNGLRRISLASANNGKSRALLLSRPGDPPLVLVDRGGGVFVPTSAWSAPSSATFDIAGGDLNGDGFLDLVFGEGGNGPAIQAQFGRSTIPPDGPSPPTVTHPFVFLAVDAAAGSSSVSPGEWLTVYGLNLLPAGAENQSWDVQGNPLPTNLAGVSVSVGGRLASISFVSSTQANVQVPDIATGDYAIIVVQTGAGTAYGSVSVGSVTPSLFESGRSAQYGILPAATAADGNPIGDPSTVPGSRPAHPGEEIILWGTGFGPTNPQTSAGRIVTPAPLANSATVLLNGQSIKPDYAGLVGVGLNQINFQVPANLPSGSYRLQVTVGAEASQSGVNLLVQ